MDNAKLQGQFERRIPFDGQFAAQCVALPQRPFDMDDPPGATATGEFGTGVGVMLLQPCGDILGDAGIGDAGTVEQDVDEPFHQLLVTTAIPTVAGLR